MTEFKPIKEGKVREIYDNGDSLIMVATDRISAFDVILKNKVTNKGKVLTQMSKFWFDYTRDLLPNHMLSVDVKEMPEFFRQPQYEGRSMMCRKLTMLPVECIVRGYITGSGWASYQKTGKVCGIQLPEGLKESEKLPEPIYTVLDFQGYVEGWGTYAEYYAYTLDHGMEEQVGELLQHNAAFTLALYALLDINIHYEGWDMDQVNDYLTMYFQIDDPSVISSIYYEVVENPSNYLSYYTGYLEFLNMREEAQQRLGANFSLLEFNRFLLDIGPAPFSVIRNYFTQWLIQNGSSN